MIAMLGGLVALLLPLFMLRLNQLDSALGSFTCERLCREETFGLVQIFPVVAQAGAYSKWKIYKPYGDHDIETRRLAD